MKNKPIQIVLLIFPVILGMLLARLIPYRQCGMKPSIQPPGWVFSVVWTALYILCGVSAMMAYRKGVMIGVFSIICVVSLLLLWWMLFSIVCNPRLSFFFIVPITGFVVSTTVLLWKENAKLSAYLLIPLVVWMCFASILSSLTF